MQALGEQDQVAQKGALLWLPQPLEGLLERWTLQQLLWQVLVQHPRRHQQSQALPVGGHDPAVLLLQLLPKQRLRQPPTQRLRQRQWRRW